MQRSYKRLLNFLLQKYRPIWVVVAVLFLFAFSFLIVSILFSCHIHFFFFLFVSFFFEENLTSGIRIQKFMIFLSAIIVVVNSCWLKKEITFRERQKDDDYMFQIDECPKNLAR